MGFVGDEETEVLRRRGVRPPVGIIGAVIVSGGNEPAQDASPAKYVAARRQPAGARRLLIHGTNGCRGLTYVYASQCHRKLHI